MRTPLAPSPLSADFSVGRKLHQLCRNEKNEDKSSRPGEGWAEVVSVDSGGKGVVFSSVVIFKEGAKSQFYCFKRSQKLAANQIQV